MWMDQFRCVKCFESGATEYEFSDNLRHKHLRDKHRNFLSKRYLYCENCKKVVSEEK
jgi:hypothetical protein